jgi:hypothetical protein
MVTPSIDRTYPLGQVSDAVRQLAAGHARGKVAVTTGERLWRRGPRPARPEGASA